MNRIIKFRAWDKEIKVMREWQEISMGSTQPVGYFFSRGDFEIMQFTGLTDKNGKEIYEGDIIRQTGKHQMTGGNIEKIWEVKWEEDCFKLMDNNPDGVHFLLGFVKNSIMTFEIIGNIYENPELSK